jgi:hypothetical protein
MPINSPLSRFRGTLESHPKLICAVGVVVSSSLNIIDFWHSFTGALDVN